VIHYDDFGRSKPESFPWQFTPESSWSIDREQSIDGEGSLRVDGKGMNMVSEARILVDLDSKQYREPVTELRLSAWTRTEKVNYRRDAILEIIVSGDGFSHTLWEFNRNTPFCYLEKTMQISATQKKVLLQIRFYGVSGTAWIDDLQLQAGTKSRPLEREKSNPFAIREQKSRSDLSWTGKHPFRIIGEIDDDYNGSPVWADLDFSRLLLAAGERFPVDPATLQVFAVQKDGSRLECPVSFADPISIISDHYLRNGTLKWRAVQGIKTYEICFSASGEEGPRPQRKNLMLGVGEAVNYPSQEENLLWAGWPGAGLEVKDVDHDGDWDIYAFHNDGGFSLLRNTGSNRSPLFLPRSRPLPTDEIPSVQTEYIMADWDGDGFRDRIFYKKRERKNRYDNIPAEILIRFSRNGKLSDPVPVPDTSGQPVSFPNSSWFSMKAADVDNDGRIDLLAGTANSQLEILLNKGMKDNLPVSSKEMIPFGFFAEDPFLSGDMSLKPFPVDWNGDGYTDIVSTGWQGFFLLFVNAGEPGRLKFKKPERLYQTGGVVVHNDSPAPYLVDWDGDGDPDIISGGCSGNIMYYENTGTKTNWQFKGGSYLLNEAGEPYFFNAVENGGTVQGLEEQYWGYLTCVPRDVDRDGDLDIIIADCLGKVRWLENIGTRDKAVMAKKPHDFLFEGSPLLTPWRNRPGVADWDGDGTLELIVLDFQSDLVMYSQSEENPSVLTRRRKLTTTDGKVFHIKRFTHPGGEGRFNMDVGDWDGDGNLDILIGEPRNYLGGGNMTIARNKGDNCNPVFEYGRLYSRSGYFTEWTGSDGHDAWHCSYPCMVDFDDDGRMDLLVGVESGRMTFYAHDYFEGEKYPVFQAKSFEVKKGKKVFQVLDFDRLSPRTQCLNTAGVQLQLLPEQAVPEVSKEAVEVNITSPGKDGMTVFGKLAFSAMASQPVREVAFYINGEQVAVELSAPYVAFGDHNLWDTATVSDGPCLLEVVVTLHNGSQHKARRKVIVQNQK
jgi:hypothetical protein